MIIYNGVYPFIMLDNTDELAFEVEFLSCVVDKKKDFEVVDADSHFCEFVGIHYSKIKQGKLSLLDILVPQDREDVMTKICKKDSPYVYFDLYLKDNSSKYNFVHATAKNNEDSSLCQITFADVGKSEKKSKQLREKAKTMNHLIDFVTGGVCLFKVNSDMRFEVLYANEACCKFFGTTKQAVSRDSYRISDLVHPDDKSRALTAIGGAMATKKPIDMELRITTHKDEYKWVKLNSDIQRYDKKDNCPIFHAMLTDITELKAAEKEAEEQKEMLLKVLKNVPGPMFSTPFDDPFRLTVASSDFLKLIGYSRTELFEEYDGDLTKLIVPREVEVARHAIESDMENDKKVLRATYSLRTKGGKQLIVLDRRKVVELDSGKKSLIGMISDITSKNLDMYFES